NNPLSEKETCEPIFSIVCSFRARARFSRFGPWRPIQSTFIVTGSLRLKKICVEERAGNAAPIAAYRAARPASFGHP
ncbi:MAG: hypothetical protein K6U88_17015, partial [Dehalococcoidia bacterium]|nr:hypothetical protein [Dehalococcoidia bacterium]